MANRHRTLGVVLAVFVAGCSDKREHPPMPHNVIAQVGGALITPEALIAYVKQTAQPVSDEAVDASLETMIRFEAAYAKATQEGFERSPHVQAAIRTNLPPDAATDEAIRSAAVKQIVVQRFLETHLGLDAGKVQVSEDEMREYFRRNLEKFHTPETVRGAAIVIRVATNAPPEVRNAARQRAETLRTKASTLLELKDYLAFVAEHSPDPATRHLGGDTGWISTDALNGWPTNLLGKLIALGVGELTPVIEAADGFYLARVVKKRPPSLVEWAAAREYIRYELAARREAEREKAFFATLKSDVYLRVNPELLKAVKQQLRTNQEPVRPAI